MGKLKYFQYHSDKIHVNPGISYSKEYTIHHYAMILLVEYNSRFGIQKTIYEDIPFTNTLSEEHRGNPEDDEVFGEKIQSHVPNYEISRPYRAPSDNPIMNRYTWFNDNFPETTYYFKNRYAEYKNRSGDASIETIRSSLSQQDVREGFIQYLYENPPQDSGFGLLKSLALMHDYFCSPHVFSYVPQNLPRSKSNRVSVSMTYKTFLDLVKINNYQTKDRNFLNHFVKSNSATLQKLLMMKDDSLIYDITHRLKFDLHKKLDYSCLDSLELSIFDSEITIKSGRFSPLEDIKLLLSNILT